MAMNRDGDRMANMSEADRAKLAAAAGVFQRYGITGGQEATPPGQEQQTPSREEQQPQQRGDGTLQGMSAADRQGVTAAGSVFQRYGVTGGQDVPTSELGQTRPATTPPPSTNTQGRQPGLDQDGKQSAQDVFAKYGDQPGQSQDQTQTRQPTQQRGRDIGR